MTTFSIVIPTYNYGDRIEATIQSVLAQKRQKNLAAEIIIVDDGSTDSTATIIGSYTKQFPHIHYLHQPNQGPAAARNRGIHEASGEFILPLDADDSLLPHALEVFQQAIQKHPQADLIVANTIDQTYKRDMKPFSSDKAVNFLHFLQKKIPVPHGANCFRRSIFNTLQYPEHIRGREDIVFYAQVFANFHAVRVSHPVCKINKHPDSFRHTSHAENKISEITESLFDPHKIPPTLMRYQKFFESGVCLSFFRAAYRARRYKEARRWYGLALKKNPFRFFEWPYLSKFLRTLLKS